MFLWGLSNSFQRKTYDDGVDEGEVEEFDGGDGNDDDDDDANAISVWHIASSDVLGWCVGVVL